MTAAVDRSEASSDTSRSSPRTVARRPRNLAVLVMSLAVVVLATFGLARWRVSDPGAPSEIRVYGAMVAETPVGFAAAVYLTIEQRGGADRLIGATSPVAGRVSLHLMEPVPGGGLMLPTEAIEIPAGTTIAMEPFGSHVMVEDLLEPLVAGSTVPVTLRFERAGDLGVLVEVIDLEQLALLGED